MDFLLAGQHPVNAAITARDVDVDVDVDADGVRRGGQVRQRVDRRLAERQQKEPFYLKKDAMG